jgi:hypothetical protein
VVIRKGCIAIALRKTGANAIDIAPFLVSTLPGRCDLESHIGSDKLAEIDRLGILGDAVQLNRNKLLSSSQPRNPVARRMFSPSAVSTWIGRLVYEKDSISFFSCFPLL